MGRAILAALAAVLLALTSGSTSAQTPPARLVVQAPTEPPGLDLTATPASATAGVVFNNIQEGLLKLDRQGKIAPSLAERWHTADNRNYTFFLKKGVRFHSGREVTAEDVKFTFTEFLKEGSVNANTQIIRDIFGGDPNNLTVVDPYTLKIRSPKPLNTVEMFRVLSAEEGRTAGPGWG